MAVRRVSDDLMIRWGQIRVDEARLARLPNLLADPRRRGAAAKILNDESRKMKAIAEELADKELHRRSADRRSSPQPGYHDSFEIIEPDLSGRRLRAGFRNTHLSARMVEEGTRDHPITARNAKTLKFPFDGPVGRGKVGALGQFPVNFGDAPTVFPRKIHRHPGAEAHHIMRRARDTYRRRAKRILNR